MLGSVSTSRRANAFADALDASRLAEPDRPGAPAERTPEGPPAPADAAEQNALLAVADELRTLPRPELSADTKAVHRAQLLAAMETAFDGGGERVPAPRSPYGSRGAHRAGPASALARLRPKSRLTKGLAAGGLSLGVAAGAFGGAAAASSNALPGDTLYGLKRGMEDLRLDFAGGGTDRGRLYLSHAATRLNEARRLMERQRSGSLGPEELAEVRRTLDSLHSDASKGHRLLSEAHRKDGSIGPLQALSSFAEKSSGTWTELRGRLPFELHDVSEDVTTLFETIEDDLEPLQALLPPEQEARDDTDGRPGHGAAPETRPAPDSPSAEREEGSATPRESTAEERRPTPEEEDGRHSSPAEEESSPGLLGGTELLNPGETAAEDEPEPSVEGAEEVPQPDVTVPPLIQDLLPGIGLDTRRTE